MYDPAHDPAWLVPEEDQSLPPDLLRPQTLVDHLRALGWRAAQADPDGDRHLAACAVLACLRVGPLLEVVDALAGDLVDKEALDHEPELDAGWVPDDDEDGAWCLPVLEQGQPIPREMLDGPVLAHGFRILARQASPEHPMWGACLAESAATLAQKNQMAAAEWLLDPMLFT